MIISKTIMNYYGNKKKKNSFSKNIFYKSILVILLFLVLSTYLISKPDNFIDLLKPDFFNKFFKDNGFIIKNIEVTGIKHLNEKDVIKIIKTFNNTNIFNINIQKLHEEISKNTWVEETSIQMIYPDTIKIFLKEKEPIAIWQNKYGNNLITKNGEIILENKLNNFKNNLPIIIGKKAHKNISPILKILNVNENFTRNIWSLTFVNERRWDVHFNQGLTIRLPSTKVREAWQKIVYLNEKFDILNLGLIEIDLRNNNQILGKINIDKKLIFKKKIS